MAPSGRLTQKIHAQLTCWMMSPPASGPVIAEIAQDEVLVGPEVGGTANIADAQRRIDALQQLAQPRSDIAGRSGQKYFVHDVTLEALVVERSLVLRCSAAMIS